MSAARIRCKLKFWVAQFYQSLDCIRKAGNYNKNQQLCEIYAVQHILFSGRISSVCTNVRVCWTKFVPMRKSIGMPNFRTCLVWNTVHNCWVIVAKNKSHSSNSLMLDLQDLPFIIVLYLCSLFTCFHYLPSHILLPRSYNACINSYW